MDNLRYLAGPMRLPFLVLTPACVSLGLAAAVWRSVHIDLMDALLVLLGALCLHIGVNALNEYYDFTSGLDFNTERTPFSGGSGTLPENPDKAPVALATGVISLVVAILVGLYFVHKRGLWLMPLGLLGIVIVIAYTGWITKNALLCLVAPGLGFGPLMVMGTDFCLTGNYSWTGFFVSLVPFFLVSDLLLLNQFPDAEADSKVGRRHLVITKGRSYSAVVYVIFLASAYLSIIVGYMLGYIPRAGFLGLGTILIAVPLARGVLKYKDDIKSLLPYMGMNVMVNIATPILMAIGMVLWRG